MNPATTCATLGANLKVTQFHLTNMSLERGLDRGHGIKGKGMDSFVGSDWKKLARMSVTLIGFLRIFNETNEKFRHHFATLDFKTF